MVAPWLFAGTPRVDPLPEGALSNERTTVR
jgi:hypothetical protein